MGHLGVRLRVVMCAMALAGSAAAQTAAHPAESTKAAQNIAPVATPAQIDALILQVLDGANSYGWDAQNKGIVINWRRDDPTQVQCNDNRCDTPDKPTRHDPINDVRLLQHMYWYEYRHPGDHHFDAAIARILPTVKDRWGHSHLEKGWVYFILERLYDYTDNPRDKSYWEEDLKGWADAQYKHIDAAAGVQHSKNLGNCDCGAHTIHLGDAYRVDHALESGAALVAAGTRFHHPEWVAAGYKEVMTVYRQTFSQQYHLFARIYMFQDATYGDNKIFDAQARMGESSEEVDALVRAGFATTDPAIRKQFWDIAAQVLTALRDLPIHDREHGGFFNSFFTADNYNGKKAGTLSGTDKESRQLSMVGTYHLANQLMTPKNQWPDMEAEMLRVVVNSFENKQAPGMFMPDTEKFSKLVNGYPGNVAGYTYHLNGDFTLYDGHAPGGENWVSNEANSLALLGLQEYLSPAQPASLAH
jgi:hypothetical protein